MPPIPGMRLSMMTSRGESASTAAIASSPDAAAPASVIPGVARTTSLATPRNTAWSSTTSTATSGALSPRGPADAPISPGGNWQRPHLAFARRTCDQPDRLARYDLLPRKPGTSKPETVRGRQLERLARRMRRQLYAARLGTSRRAGLAITGCVASSKARVDEPNLRQLDRTDDARGGQASGRP